MSTIAQAPLGVADTVTNPTLFATLVVYSVVPGTNGTAFSVVTRGHGRHVISQAQARGISCQCGVVIATLAHSRGKP